MVGSHHTGTSAGTHNGGGAEAGAWPEWCVAFSMATKYLRLHVPGRRKPRDIFITPHALQGPGA
eukprot:6135577-Pyramimonas_sp.AAC.1